MTDYENYQAIKEVMQRLVLGEAPPPTEWIDHGGRPRFFRHMMLVELAELCDYYHSRVTEGLDDTGRPTGRGRQ